MVLLTAQFDLEKVEDYIHDLNSADKFIISSMVLESAVFSLILVNLEVVAAYDKTGEDEVRE